MAKKVKESRFGNRKPTDPASRGKRNMLYGLSQQSLTLAAEAEAAGEEERAAKEYGWAEKIGNPFEAPWTRLTDRKADNIIQGWEAAHPGANKEYRRQRQEMNRAISNGAFRQHGAVRTTQGYIPESTVSGASLDTLADVIRGVADRTAAENVRLHEQLDQNAKVLGVVGKIADALAPKAEEPAIEEAVSQEN